MEMQEHHTGQKPLLVTRRRSKEHEELHRNQKNPLLLHTYLKERLVRHMSLKRLMENHMNLKNLKAVNQTRKLELVVLHRSSKKKLKPALYMNC